ncbi:MAG TPA: di-trans,poly-cis-decaprenylcistransferase [Candidatus Eisenbacteria bacterium]|jgi:undecaprenyl diphosphate synthase
MASVALPRSGRRLHVALIMDGNGRWAEARGLARAAGHRAGVEAVRRIGRAASGLGIGTLTLYAFSSDNWRRPGREVRSLMELLRDFFVEEGPLCARQGVRLSVIGRRDRLPAGLRAAVEAAEAATARGTRLHMRVALDYSARDAILRAARVSREIGRLSRGQFGRLVAGAEHGPVAARVELLVRTGGEQRLSDFMLWESAYAELIFTPTLWPDFSAQELAAAVREFQRRHRRFGGLTRQAAS